MELDLVAAAKKEPSETHGTRVAPRYSVAVRPHRGAACDDSWQRPAHVTVALVLSGCSLFTWLPGPDVTAPPLAVGVCLDGMNGADADRTSVVDCGEPHLFQITAIDQWPGMADALDAADGDRGAVWDDIHHAGGTAGSAEYGEWASRNCNEAAQRVAGITDVEVDGHTAGDLWLRVGGTYGVDLSLGSREEFVAGDVSTICSVAWYDDAGEPLPDQRGPVRRGCCIRAFDIGLRECLSDRRPRRSRVIRRMPPRSWSRSTGWRRSDRN